MRFCKISILFVLCLVTPIEAAELLRYQGIATDLKTQEIIYTDNYTEYKTRSGSTHARVEYRNTLGELIATKDIQYDSQRSSPSFQFSNIMTGVYAAVDVKPSAMELLYKKSQRDLATKESIPRYTSAVVDAGFHYFIVQEWTSLMAGEIALLKYVSPSHQTAYKLRARKLKEELWKGKQTAVFSVEVDNFVLRLFVDPIILRYETITKRLRSYEGLSNIAFPSGTKKVYLEMTHYEAN
jgi:hypothetical protein